MPGPTFNAPASGDTFHVPAKGDSSDTTILYVQYPAPKFIATIIESPPPLSVISYTTESGAFAGSASSPPLMTFGSPK